MKIKCLEGTCDQFVTYNGGVNTPISLPSTTPQELNLQSIVSFDQVAVNRNPVESPEDKIPNIFLTIPKDLQKIYGVEQGEPARLIFKEAFPNEFSSLEIDSSSVIAHGDVNDTILASRLLRRVISVPLTNFRNFRVGLTCPKKHTFIYSISIEIEK